METVEIGGSVVRFDARATRDAYRRIEPVPWGECCATYANWDAAVERSAVFPPEVAALLTRLGIDPRKPAEQWEIHEVEPGVHLYHVWYHCLGIIEKAGAPWLLSPEEQVYVLNQRSLAFGPFRGAPDVVQIEVVTAISWLIDEPPYGRLPAGPAE